MRLAGPIVAAFAASALAQYVSQDRRSQSLTVVRSPGDSSVTVSYKEPSDACRTVFHWQKQYTGWVNILDGHPTNLFFWFVEARSPTDSLTIWLNGGPGLTSLNGFFNGNGPCEVVEKGLDEYDTVAREWGWDRASNMLFVDQPNQAGLSYDVPTNGTKSLLSDSFLPLPTNDSALAPWARVNGTFSSNRLATTVNTTQQAAQATWRLVQAFLSTFPQYQPRSDTSTAISLFAESYGGIYAPIFAERWEMQNELRRTGGLPTNSTLELRLTSLGIINGCIDRTIEVPLYASFVSNNTYGIKAYSQNEARFYQDKAVGKGGCKDLVTQCEALSLQLDPDGLARDATVNKLCERAASVCGDVESAYSSTGRGVYDIAARAADPKPPLYFLDYVNQAKTQEAIGSPINLTFTSESVFRNFYQTGDRARGGNTDRLARLVQKGIRVGLIYGDRDYVCNWFGGEAVALAIAQKAGGDYATRFPAAGYAPIITNQSYVGGDVRQYGNLSFSRIFQAGHSAAAYQPETVFQVFARILMGKSLSTGKDVDLKTFNTTGPPNSTSTAEPPEPPEPTCFVRGFNSTCNNDAHRLAESGGGGVVINGVLYSKSEDWPLATASAPASETTSATHAMTGIFTATTTPASTAAPSHLSSTSTVLGVIYAMLILSGNLDSYW